MIRFGEGRNCAAAVTVLGRGGGHGEGQLAPCKAAASQKKSTHQRPPQFTNDTSNFSYFSGQVLQQFDLVCIHLQPTDTTCAQKFLRSGCEVNLDRKELQDVRFTQKSRHINAISHLAQCNSHAVHNAFDQIGSKHSKYAQNLT